MPAGGREPHRDTPNRLWVLGLAVDDLTMAETLEVIDAFIKGGGVHQHVVVNVSKVVQARRDPALAAIIAACDLVNVDGQPIVWASRKLGHRCASASRESISWSDCSPGRDSWPSGLPSGCPSAGRPGRCGARCL